YGGSIRLADAAVSITPRSVVTASGDRIETRAVVAACHVLTALELLGDAKLLDRARAIRVGNGIGMVLRLGTTGRPPYPAARAEDYRALQLRVPDRAILRAAYGDFLAGRCPDRPATLAMSFSAFDPTIAPTGRHNVTVWGQWHPYDGAERWQDIA